MKNIQGTPLLVSLLAGAGMVAACLPVLANVDAECRQEAEDYGIPPEQLDDYITGCILSRGGNYVQEPAAEDYTAPVEAEDYTAPVEPEISTDADSGIDAGDVPQ
jgi:hypothetical protein